MGWAHSSAGRRLAMRDAGLWILATNYEGGSAARAKSLAKKHKNTKLKTFCFPASSEIFLAHEGGLRGASPSLVEVEGAVKGRPLIRPCRPSAHAVTCEAAQFFDLEKILGRIFLCLCNWSLCENLLEATRERWRQQTPHDGLFLGTGRRARPRT